MVIQLNDSGGIPTTLETMMAVSRLEVGLFEIATRVHIEPVIRRMESVAANRQDALPGLKPSLFHRNKAIARQGTKTMS